MARARTRTRKKETVQEIDPSDLKLVGLGDVKATDKLYVAKLVRSRSYHLRELDHTFLKNEEVRVNAKLKKYLDANCQIVIKEKEEDGSIIEEHKPLFTFVPIDNDSEEDAKEAED